MPLRQGNEMTVWPRNAFSRRYKLGISLRDLLLAEKEEIRVVAGKARVKGGGQLLPRGRRFGKARGYNHH